MGKATTTKRINPAQLTGHLPTDTVRVRGDLDSDEEKTVEVEDMTDEEIQAALSGYVYDENHGKPQSEVQLRAVRDKARAVVAGSDTFTVQQMQQLVARLVLRELNEEE